MFIKNSSNKLTYNSKPNALRPTPVHDLFEKEIHETSNLGIAAIQIIIQTQVSLISAVP